MNAFFLILSLLSPAHDGSTAVALGPFNSYEECTRASTESKIEIYAAAQRKGFKVDEMLGCYDYKETITILEKHGSK